MRKDIKISVSEKIQNIFEQVILNYKLINDGDKIVVAVSGGPDSMCLLDILNKLKDNFKQKYNIEYSLVVAHVNHMIRAESEQEKIYVQDFCENIDIPFYYLKENVPENSKKFKMSEETYGRKIRYDFFEEVLQKENAQRIAVAHNLDDNVETIILNIIRGCGLNGLTGMDYSFENIIRPLLDIEKSEIMEYNILQNLKPCIDKTNFEANCTRNRVRNILIPELKQSYNTNILQSITRMKKLVSLDESFLNQYTNNIVNDSIISCDNNILKFTYSNIMGEHDSIKQRCIREIIKRKIKNLDGIENVHILDILKLLDNNIKGKKYIIGNKLKLEIIKKDTAIIY